MDVVPVSGVTEDTGDTDQGTDVDKVHINNGFKMDVESPSSEELEHLGSQTDETDDSDSDLNSQSYTIQKGDATQRFKDENRAESASPITEATTDPISDTGKSIESSDNIENKEPVEKKPRKDKKVSELSTPEKRLSSDASKFMDVNLSGSRPGSAASSAKSGSGREKGEESKKLYMIWSGRVDPGKKEKDKEREERIRQAQQKLAEERQKKLEEMREQQRLAQENREKQLEARRRKIEELKRREEERRRTVEERRRLQEETDRVKKEAILSKAKERLTRYEQWKTSGRKGAPPGYSPPSKHLSVSTSVLYHKRSPEFSSTGALNTSASSGMAGIRSGAESLMALNTIPENRLGRSFIASSAPPSRHKSSVNLGASQPGVKMRERSSPRKPRPSSVATSMPSFVQVETPKSSRSKSTDRHARVSDRGVKQSSPGRKEDKTDGQDDKHKAATLPRPYDRRKIEERRQEVKKKAEDKEKDDKPPVRLTKSFIERMAVPKHPSPEKKDGVKEPTPVRAKPLKRDRTRESPVRQPLKATKDKAEKDTSSETKSETDKSEGSETQSLSPAPAQEVSKRHSTEKTDVEKADISEKSASPQPPSEVKVKEPEPAMEPEGAVREPEEKTSPRPKQEPRQSTPEPKVAFKDEVKTIPVKTDKEREMEEYKAKLAERRRLAREKAEREAEIERLRQEELQRQEEERLRLEEERQRREEEEALRLAEEARKAEEERLQRAIEAEEKRRKEEAERLERERIEREESDRKAREEAERLEKERQERSRREEEERLERKKRLEMIMKRVKTDSPGTTPEKTRTESPTRVLQGSSSRGSLVSSEDEKGDDSEKEDKADSDDAPKFKSPLLQKLTEQKAQNGDSGVPKFKSPLLQSLMGKTKIGSRLSSSTTKLDETPKTEEKSEIIMSKSSSSLMTDDSEGKYDKESVKNGQFNSYDSSEDILKMDKLDSVRGADSHDTDSTVIDYKATSETDKQITDSGVGEISPSSDTGVKDGLPDVQVVDTTVDSAVSLSYNGVTSHNGDIHIDPKEDTGSKELVDSSISMRTVDSFGSSQTDSFGGSFFDSQTLTTSQTDPSQFEEIIDLTVSNKTLKSQQLQDRLLNHSEDLLNLNNIDNNCMSSSTSDVTTIPGKPIIAFEDNASRRQDVPDSIDVNASMATADRSANNHLSGDENHIDAAAASAHASNVRHSKISSAELTYVSTPGRHDKQADLAAVKLNEDPELSEHLETLWHKLEGIMGDKMDDTKKVLEVYGINEGDEDSETEEGQIWRMVQGDAPYTLNLV